MADPRFAYLCEQHHEGLVRLIYMARTRKLGGVLTGPYGIGKSMLLELLAQDLRRDNASQFISMDCMPGKPITAVRHILTLMNYAEQAQTFQDPFEAIAFLRRKGTLLKHTVLAIDEAQSINDPDFYNFLLLLTNITFTDRQHGLLPAFTIILVGTGELHQAVMSRELMSQRLPFTWNLEPLNQKQVVEYIQPASVVEGVLDFRHRVGCAVGGSRLTVSITFACRADVGVYR